MKTNRRGLLIVISASLIAGFLILEDVVNQREVDEFNRAQLREQFGGHIHYHGTWTSDMACLFALAIVAIEGRALVIAVRRVRAGRKSPQIFAGSCKGGRLFLSDLAERSAGLKTGGRANAHT